MRISFNKYPIDIIAFLLWSVFFTPILLLNFEGTIRIILGLPVILFITGYILIFALFPTRKTYGGIDVIERIILSFGLSIPIVSLIGLGFNYTPWGIRIGPIFISILIFIIGVGSFAIYRWICYEKNERFIINIDVSFPKSKNKLDNVLSIILVLFIILSTSLFIYVIATPKTGEKFTELYLLDPDRIAINYPRNIGVGKNTSVIIGLVNHEYKTVDYTIEIWLINQTTIYNEMAHQNETIYNNMWFLDKINITLNHIPIDLEKAWEPQWDYNYTFNISKNGTFKLAFLLFIDSTQNYSRSKDYEYIAETKINSAYRVVYLWINVS